MKKLAAAVFFIVMSAPASYAAPLVIGDLKGGDCSFVDKQSESEVVGYWRRRPPFVGYHKGEQLFAGGDGTCVLGFPRSNDERALVLVNGLKIPVFFTAEREDTRVYVSRDGSVKVELTITGTESTCNPDEDNCCGEYTYVTITVRSGKRNSSVRAATYVGQ